MSTFIQPQLYSVNHFSCLTVNNIGCRFGAMKLKDRLHQARTEKRLTQKQLSEKAGVSQQMISKLESGGSEGTAEILVLAEALDVSPYWLAYEKGEKNDYVKDAIERQLLFFYRNLSEDRQYSLIGKANSLYVEQHPNDRSAGPYNGIERRSSQESIDFPGRRAEDVLPTPTTGGSVRGKRNGKKGDSK